jgi:hypothetical protein
MKMKNILISSLFLLLLASCGNKKKSSVTDTKDTAATKPVVVDNTQKVIYKSATYYAGRVDFFFKDEAGGEVVVGISNLPEDSGAVYPAYLLESTENLEGPPGENPAMVGKPFLLIKNAAGEVREIKPAN